MIKTRITFILIFLLLPFYFACETAQKAPETKPAAEKPNPALDNTVIDLKEYYEDGSLKSEGKALYKIENSTILKIKQQKWVYYYKGNTNAKMSEGEYSEGKQNGKWSFFSNDGKLTETGSYTEGLNTGEWSSYFPTGEIKSKSNYSISQQKDEATGQFVKKSFIDGKKTSFFKEGQVQKEEEFKLGIKNGRSQEYYPKGNPKEITMFKDNLKNGALNEWFENGKKKTDGFFTDDKKTGSWKMFYSSGQLMMEGSFANDKIDGPWKIYSREGLLMKEGKYLNGKENGLWTFYEYNNGRKMIYAEYPVLGGMVTTGSSKVYENGVLTGEGYLNGLPKAQFQIIKNGQPGEIIEAQNAPEDDPSGQITSKWTGKWKPLAKNGIWKEYYPGTNHVMFEANFMTNKKNGVYKEYYKSGALKCEGKYLNDKKNDQWKYYNEDGSIDAELSGLYMMDKKRGK